jgi:hypothetical protein
MSISLRGLAAGTAVAAGLIALSATSASAATVPHFKMPKVYGTTFQADPKHDFTKHISPRHDGILRGWVTFYHGGVAEYEPIRWVPGKADQDGFFAGPAEGDVRAYASKVSPKAVLYSVSNCNPAGTKLTIDNRGLGTKACSRKALLAHLKTGHVASMITVYHGRIVKIQEISTP